MKQRYCAHGMTMVELLAVVVAMVVIGTVLVSFGGGPRNRTGARQLKDATQVRGIQQALAIWANDNAGLYPLPSRIDGNDATVAEKGEAKDVTANIWSVLIYTGGISVELAISPAESHGDRIVMDDDYMFDAPKTAIDPTKALWDPAFAADFTAGKIGNVSHAHVLPGGTHGARWKDTFNTTEAVVGNRGPQIKSVAYDSAGEAKPSVADADTYTFLIHGSRRAWEGNVAFNDGHVNFETSMNPSGMTYTNQAGKWWTDNLFYDEPDDAVGLNTFMSIWTKAGATNAEFIGIWD